MFVSEGSGWIQGATRTELAAYDAVALPPGRFLLVGAPGLRVLEVTSTTRPREPERTGNVPYGPGG